MLAGVVLTVLMNFKQIEFITFFLHEFIEAPFRLMLSIAGLK